MSLRFDMNGMMKTPINFDNTDWLNHSILKGTAIKRIAIISTVKLLPTWMGGNLQWSSIMDSDENIRLFHKMWAALNTALTIFGLSFIERDTLGLYRLSLKRLAYGLLITMLVLFVFYEQITRFYPRDLDNIVLILLFLYMAVVGTLMALAMITTGALNAPTLANILNNPEYNELFALDSYEFVSSHTLRQFLFACLILVACYVSDFLADVDSSLLTAVKIMMFFLFPMYNSFCISEYFVYHYWLQSWYWNVNTALLAMLGTHWWADQKPHALALVDMGHWVHMGARAKLPARRLDSDSMMAVELVRLRRLRHKTHSFAQSLDQLYSLRNVLLLIHHCALEIVYTYWGLRHTLQDLNVPLTAILNFYKAACMSFVSVVSMVWPCAITRVQAKRTSYLVEDLLVKVRDGNARVELQIFALQLLQERCQFAPHGFFEMETTLLLSLLAIVTSYLVILLQYHMVHLLKANKDSLSDAMNATFTC